jgi:hypothetical protein
MRTCLAFFIAGLMLSFDANEQWTTVSAADPSASLRADLPANIIIDTTLTDVAVEMLRDSQTFRSQCQRLGMVRLLQVRVSLDSEPRTHSREECRAMTIIRRYQFGRIEADVRLRTAIDSSMLIAHELEHIREYVEGMNYSVASVQDPTRVWISAQGHYETSRAIETGERVASEMSRARARQSAATLARRAP